MLARCWSSAAFSAHHLLSSSFHLSCSSGLCSLALLWLIRYFLCNFLSGMGACFNNLFELLIIFIKPVFMFVFLVDDVKRFSFAVSYNTDFSVFQHSSEELLNGCLSLLLMAVSRSSLTDFCFSLPMSKSAVIICPFFNSPPERHLGTCPYHYNVVSGATGTSQVSKKS